jgi:chemotaxis protein histidine kinase CheA
MAEGDDTGMDGLLRETLYEARDILEEADAWGDELFGDPADPESRSRLIDVVHTVKEACDQLPLPRLEAVAQAATEAADALHEKHVVPTHATMTTILSAIGRMRDILDTVEAEGAEPTGDDAALLGALSAIAGHQLLAPAPRGPEPGPKVAPAVAGAAGDGHRRYVIFRTATGGPKALDAAFVAWMDVIDAVADGPDGGAIVRVQGRTLPLAALDGGIPEAGRLPAPRPVIVLKVRDRRLALLVEDVLTLTLDPAAALPAAAEIVAVERLFAG